MGSDGNVRASHLLVKHKDSRRPSSWKEPTVTRTKVLISSRYLYTTISDTTIDCRERINEAQCGQFAIGWRGGRNERILTAHLAV